MAERDARTSGPDFLRELKKRYNLPNATDKKMNGNRILESGEEG